MGETLQFTATPKDANGQILAGRSVSWSSNNTAVVEVSSSGLVTGMGAGSATVTAVCEGKSGSASLMVPAFALTVSKAGAGSGTVTSTPAGVDCGGDCSEEFASGTVVTLLATASGGSEFGGWGGACSGTNTTCSVTMDAVQTVAATFQLKLFSLTVTREGGGSGTVTSTPTGIDCGVDCSQEFTFGTTVTLTATPGEGSVFAGWSGVCSGTELTCQVTMDASKEMGATFLPVHDLAVTTGGTGSGDVTSDPSGIDCGADCSELFASGTVVTLTATPDVGSVFTGWSGACAGTAVTCQVTMDAAKQVTATFNLTDFTLTVTRAGEGSGTVTSDPAGIDCGASCSADYGAGALVTLTATANPGSVLEGWSGACSGAAATCQVTMDAAKQVTATFVVQTFTLTVTRAGTGSGTLTSVPAGIDCGGSCSASYGAGVLVTLTANASMGSVLVGWTGACSGTEASCQVILDDDKIVTATFNLLGVGFGEEQFVELPAGNFLMGDRVGNGFVDELPVHGVTFTESFFIQKTEVTQSQWQAVMGNNPSLFNACGEVCPVEQVSWDDVQLFLAALNAIDPGKEYRLPTEAEWEYACRAGTAGAYGGTGLLGDMGWYNENSAIDSQRQTHPVARKLANDWGLFDMHGNVEEWVQDWYAWDYYAVSPSSDPPGPASGTRRVYRGGSWDFNASLARSSARGGDLPSNGYFFNGLRLVRKK